MQNTELTKFLKENKTRRALIAKRNGYDTWEAYADFLRNGVGTAGNPTILPLVYCVDLLDTSSSMNWSNKIAKANEGLAAALEPIRNEKNVDYIYSLITFANALKDVRFRSKDFSAPAYVSALR